MAAATIRRSTAEGSSWLPIPATASSTLAWTDSRPSTVSPRPRESARSPRPAYDGPLSCPFPAARDLPSGIVAKPVPLEEYGHAWLARGDAVTDFPYRSTTLPPMHLAVALDGAG